MLSEIFFVEQMRCCASPAILSVISTAVKVSSLFGGPSSLENATVRGDAQGV